MVRRSLCIFACTLLLAGCNRPPGPYGLARGGQTMNMVAEIAPAGSSAAPQQFSYSHVWTLLMAREAVSPRFQRARDLCLRDKSLSCRLVSANITMDGTAGTAATLLVLLPHGKLDVFEKGLRQPVASEKPGDVSMPSRSTQAQSVENEAGDTGRKVEQLSAYRDRLAALAQRPNLSIDDIIRLEAEQSRVQNDLDDALSRKRDLTDGIARESLTVQLSERVTETGPILQVLRDAGETFADSTADALRFLIEIIPWLPILAAGLFLVSWLWRLFRRRRDKAVQTS